MCQWELVPVFNNPRETQDEEWILKGKSPITRKEFTIIMPKFDQLIVLQSILDIPFCIWELYRLQFNTQCVSRIFNVWL